jgi:MoaA/NifB/PqqE/SkfB family radical SAM enzyme
VTPDDVRTEIVLRAVRPLAPGAIGGDGFALVAVELHPTMRLSFRGPGGSRFAVRFQRNQPGARYFATSGRIDLILDASGQPSPTVERFVQALAVQIRTNTAAMNAEELAALTEIAESVNPALRRRTAIGAANLLDINVGDGCNLSCTFCTDVDSRGRDLFRPTSFWLEELARAREEGKAGLLISGNEPTLRPDIPEIVAAARRLGFVEVELSTAGVRLADRGYLAELLGAGVNVLAVSIHGSNAETDGRQTGRPDFFEPRRRGFGHFLDLVGDRRAQDARGVYLKTITIFTRDNLSDLPALVSFLDRHEASYILLHYPWVKGAAEHNFDEVVPDYAAVMNALEPLRPRLQQTSGALALANLPPCVVPDLAIGRTSRKDIVRPSAKQDGQAGPFLRVVSTMDPTLTYGKCCQACALRERCRGVPQRYLERFGETGMRAMDKGE